MIGHRQAHPDEFSWVGFHHRTQDDGLGIVDQFFTLLDIFHDGYIR